MISLGKKMWCGLLMKAGTLETSGMALLVNRALTLTRRTRSSSAILLARYSSVARRAYSSSAARRARSASRRALLYGSSGGREASTSRHTWRARVRGWGRPKDLSFVIKRAVKNYSPVHDPNKARLSRWPTYSSNLTNHGHKALFAGKVETIFDEGVLIGSAKHFTIEEYLIFMRRWPTKGANLALLKGRSQNRTYTRFENKYLTEKNETQEHGYANHK